MRFSRYSAIALAGVAIAIAPVSRSAPKPAPICAACIKATMDQLAGDDLHGRKCGGADENAAARYLAGALEKLGVKGGLPGGGYLQEVKFTTPTYASQPTLEAIDPSGATLRLANGREMILQGAPPELIEAPIVRVADAGPPFDPVKGKIVIYDGGASLAIAATLQRSGAAAVIMSAPEVVLQHWAEMAARSPGRTEVQDAAPRSPASPSGPLIFVKAETLATFEAFAGSKARLTAPRGEPRTRMTYNVVGVLHGKGAEADHEAVLLTSHYDHLGVRDGVTFHGANDDASGTAAVMEFARILGRGRAHRRTVYFSMFGCEEEGGLGAQYFLGHAPVAVGDIATNLEFEMIGVDDPNHPGFLMLTGWDRSNLGPTLAAHGAQIGPDPYPDQHFFQRSDNYQLALQGVIAQTVSAWPVPPTYHQASDDLAHVDLALMARVIGSLVEPVTWLLDSSFTPAWNPGQRP